MGCLLPFSGHHLEVAYVTSAHISLAITYSWGHTQLQGQLTNSLLFFLIKIKIHTEKYKSHNYIGCRTFINRTHMHNQYPGQEQILPEPQNPPPRLYTLPRVTTYLCSDNSFTCFCTLYECNHPQIICVWVLWHDFMWETAILVCGY